VTLPQAHPLPYAGEGLDRWTHRGTPFSRDSHGRDSSGTKLYRFNSLGYRGAEFDPDAAKHLFVFGESHAFGDGLNEEETWAEKLTHSWCAANAVARSSVCLSNFAEGACSNAYIARAVITQCEQVRPDLVVIEFAEAARAEAFMAGRTARTGDWLAQSANQLEALPNEEVRQLARELIRRAAAYERFATPVHHAVDTMLNMILVRSYCAARGLTVVASADCLEELRSVAAELPLAGMLWQTIDDGHFLAPTCMRDFVDVADRAADGSHPGASAHSRFADAMLGFLQSPAANSRATRATACATLWLGESDGGNSAIGANDVDLRRSGISNVGIARELMLALATHQPERIVFQFADFERSEGFDRANEPFDVPSPHESSVAARWGLSGKQRKARGRDKQKRAYREFATEGRGALESLRWILFAQYMTQARAIPAVGRCPRWSRLAGSEAQGIEVLSPLLAQIDPAFLLHVDAVD